MQLRYRIPLVLTFAMLLAGSAFAGQKPAVTLTPLPAGGEHAIKIGQPLSSHVACVMGVTGAPTFVFDYFLPPDDSYYTYLNPADCPSCGPGGLLIHTAHVMLYFQATPCPTSVTVGIDGATGDPLCREPNPNDPICPGTSFVIDPPAPGLYDVSFALPAACCITSDAFLRFTVDGLSCDDFATRPLLVLQGECDPCVSWNVYPGGFTEFCSDIGAPNPIHWVEADCCDATPSRSNSWGRIKTMYR